MVTTFFPLFVAQLGGLGKAPVAPGTVATVVAGIPSAYLLSRLSDPWPPLLLIFLLLAGCYVAGVAENELQRTDPAEVVIDELIGFLITMYGFPFSLSTVALGMVGFRLLDIWKPWPVKAFQEQLKGGVAIVMDDVAAGVMAHAFVWAALKIWG